MKRPHIPLKVRCIVAARQLGDPHFCDFEIGSLGRVLARQLAELASNFECAVSDLQLDHNPALILREFNKRTGKWTPDANDPDYLIYRDKHAHHIKTNVRGDGALRSDTAERVHQRKLEKNRKRREAVRAGKPKKKVVKKTSWVGKKPSQIIPQLRAMSRTFGKLQSRSTWPTGKRPIPSRGFK